MSGKFIPGYTTDLTGYALRISAGRVLYVDQDGFLRSCSIEEAFRNHLKDLYKKNDGSPALHRDYHIYGYSNKNAFKSAAKKMREGQNLSQFYHVALNECEQWSIKTRTTIQDTHNLILKTLDPLVTEKKSYKIITIRFKINPAYAGKNPVRDAMLRIVALVHTAKEQLYLIDEFKGATSSSLPDPCEIKINTNTITISFKCK